VDVSFVVVGGKVLDRADLVERRPLPDTVEVASTNVMAAGEQGSINWKDDYGNGGTDVFSFNSTDEIDYIDEMSTFPEHMEDDRGFFDSAARELIEEANNEAASEEESEMPN
ncbi:MAG: hypothetical protein LRY37_01580, partial [Alkalibacterium thalassium]|nr:hypothetical protein [Alkalibacterium thalassium]